MDSLALPKQAQSAINNSHFKNCKIHHPEGIGLPLTVLAMQLLDQGNKAYAEGLLAGAGDYVEGFMAELVYLYTQRVVHASGRDYRGSAGGQGMDRRAAIRLALIDL
jgi:hypothetical protein